jgi:hypothetical protein
MFVPQLKRASAAVSIAHRFFLALVALIAAVLAVAANIRAQTEATPEGEPGKVVGTVSDTEGECVSNATVVLNGPEPAGYRAIVTQSDGFFEFEDVNPGSSYTVSISADGFSGWTSSAMSVAPGEFKILGDIGLRIRKQATAVPLSSDRPALAAEQFQREETQRLLGIVPNAQVVYDSNPAPLTANRKFQLSFKGATDPVTFAAVGLIAGAEQAAGGPPRGAKGYGERFGAVAGNTVSGILIGTGILPSLLHQDPRYFYQGTGSTGSRFRHAFLHPFIAKGDNGRWQPNYSSLGGNLASSAISSAYYPGSERGARLVLGNFVIGTAERIGTSLAQEFVLAKITRRRGHLK